MYAFSVRDEKSCSRIKGEEIFKLKISINMNLPPSLAFLLRRFYYNTLTKKRKRYWRDTRYIFVHTTDRKTVNSFHRKTLSSACKLAEFAAKRYHMNSSSSSKRHFCTSVRDIRSISRLYFRYYLH